MSNLCNVQQESLLLTEAFFNLIFKQTMSIKAESLAGVSATEAATFKNVLDTASNFWQVLINLFLSYFVLIMVRNLNSEKKGELAKFVPLNWIHECVMNTNNHPELCASLGKGKTRFLF